MYLLLTACYQAFWFVNVVKLLVLSVVGTLCRVKEAPQSHGSLRLLSAAFALLRRPWPTRWKPLSWPSWQLKENNSIRKAFLLYQKHPIIRFHFYWIFRICVAFFDAYFRLDWLGYLTVHSWKERLDKGRRLGRHVWREEYHEERDLLM